MKSILLIILIFNLGIVNSQSLCDDLQLDETNFFYKDSANGVEAFGDYKPTDLIELHDSSLLVSTQFSINFPFDGTQGKYDSSYFQRRNICLEKSHISSGSVFKLNKNLKKDWEIIFRGKRVVKILKATDNRIFIVGEEVLMKHFWLAEINLKGELIWLKTYKHNMDISIANALIDRNNEIYILIESEKLVPFRIVNDGGHKRFEFFRNAGIYDMALVKILSDGKRKWTRTIDGRKKVEKFGYELVLSDSLIFVTSSFEGFKKRKGESEKFMGKQLSVLNHNGKIIRKNSTPERDILFFQKELYSITSLSRDTLMIYKGDEQHDFICVNGVGDLVQFDGMVVGKNGNFLLASITVNDKEDYLRLIRLGENYKFEECWAWSREGYGEIKGAVELTDGSIILAVLCYGRMERELNDYTVYIKIVRIKNSCGKSGFYKP